MVDLNREPDPQLEQLVELAIQTSFVFAALDLIEDPDWPKVKERMDDLGVQILVSDYLPSGTIMAVDSGKMALFYEFERI